VRRGRLDLASLVAGLALIVVGLFLLLDRTGALDIRFSALWPMLAALVGAVLLAAGLDDRRRGR
jgi:hypothetical protein